MAPSPNLALALALALLLLSARARASVPLESCLAPGQTASRLFIDFTQPQELCLRGPLEPGATYELHISYPHTQPTIFALTLVEREPIAARPPGHGAPISSSSISTSSAEASSSSSSSPSPNAPPLDMEKLVFRAVQGENGEVLVDYPASLSRPTPAERVYIRMEASERGFRQQGSSSLPRRGTWYDLRFDRVWGGFLPERALSLLYLVPLAVILAAVATRWLLRSKSSPIRVALDMAREGSDDVTADGGRSKQR